jgi:hypothetical protein
LGIEAHLLAVDYRDPPRDEPVAFKAVDSPPARRGGQSHPVGELGRCQAGIALQLTKDVSFKGI